MSFPQKPYFCVRLVHLTISQPIILFHMIQTRDDFWNLIDDAIQNAPYEGRSEYLIMRLAKAENQAIIRFEEIFGELMTESYRWDLWAAECVMNRGTSDDTFDYFRAWLIIWGKDVYERVIQNPDDLATLIMKPTGDEYYDYEDLLYVSQKAFAQKNGIDEEDVLDHFDIHHLDYTNGECIGEEWTEDDLPKIVPKLYTLFSNTK